ncbi:TIR domain-containing protein [Rheinheimera sp.]|jgi:hypothetical protein|uniref:TIR domain-containing protein n=1 Tax=Rheinheimera sp. TaxID=1869214 RepID=UPI00307F8128
MTLIKRKVFVSHYRGDRTEVDRFIEQFGHVFIPRVLGANGNDEFINSTNTDYVMQCIRDKYLGDSTVTIVLLGSCTHSRRYIDWEIKSSLRQGQTLPNGLIGISLPSQDGSTFLPSRLKDNWNIDHQNCYARYWRYPSTHHQLSEWIEDAFHARTSRAKYIVNSAPMMIYNSKCKNCGETH